MKPQVDISNYQGIKYDSKERFINYWNQINSVIKIKPLKVLEIGVGNGFVSNYLKKQGIKIISVDIDSRLKPNFICSVTNLSKKFKPNSFDTVLCCEVLEHLPFTKFHTALYEIYSISSKNVILSLPYIAGHIYFSIKLPNLKLLRIDLRIPFFWRKHKFDGQHYWEIGKKGFSLRTIKKELSNYFNITKIFYPLEDKDHLFFILEKK